MKMYHMIILLLMADLIASAEGSSTIENIRRLFENAARNETSCDQLIGILGKVDDPNSTHLIQGYRGVALMIKARYNYNPYTKYNKFVKGKKMLEYAIVKDKNNIELRYLRFAIQNNVPKILGYNNNIEDDKNVLISELHNLSDVTLKRNIASLLLMSNQCNAIEKEWIRKQQKNN